MTAVTVLIPTHNHWSTLPYAVQSALVQTIQDLEVFIVGDGVGDETRAVVADLMRDSRVRFFDNPKGARHGELHRHQALQSARGDVVCYLSDDDLWLPDHLERIVISLADADFVAGCALGVDPNGARRLKVVDLTHLTRQRKLGKYRSGLSVSQVGHTLTAYRQLPWGWRTTPDAVSVISYLCQQFFAQPWCRAAMSWMPTVVHLGSSARPGWSAQQRAEELSDWAERIARPDFRHELLPQMIELGFAAGSKQAMRPAAFQQPGETLARVTAELEARLEAQQAKTETLRANVASLLQAQANLKERLNRHKAKGAALRLERKVLQEKNATLRSALATRPRLLTWLHLPRPYR